MSVAAVSHHQRDALVDALLGVSGAQDPNTRDLWVADLRTALRRPLGIRRFADARSDLASLLDACATCSGGLRTVARIVQARGGGAAGERFSARVEESLGATVLSTPDRVALRDLLAEVSILDIAEAVTALPDAGELRQLQAWRDVTNAIRIMERVATPDREVPLVLTFAAGLAHQIGGDVADRLRAWSVVVAPGLGGGGPVIGQPDHDRAGADASARRAEEPGLIWGGGIPIRNRNFTGRSELLDRLARELRAGSTTAVLPQTLHGMGGVGKTQLVIEYIYRHISEYDLVWWIPAEQTSTVLASLTQLAERLGLPSMEDRQQTARLLLDALADTEMSWLLVYDNADEPDSLSSYVPSSGGHVVLTTRNQEWASFTSAVEVDVFRRAESVELLRRRMAGPDGTALIGAAEAEELAEKLGDLPLALEQAAAWFLATAMPVTEYIDLLDNHVADLLSEGKPIHYPLTIAAFVALAVHRLRDAAPATAQLFELFAFLGGEPIPVSVLRRGRDAEMSEPLRSMLGAIIPTSRAVRDLNRFGLTKVDASQRVQVHRLVQRVLRDGMDAATRDRTLANVQNMLAAANPGDPDEHGDVTSHRDLGPHLDAADMIHSSNPDARRAVLDHARYLFITGDYENSRRLASAAAEVWQGDTSDPRLGVDGEFTLLAKAQQANAMRTLGEPGARELLQDTYERFHGNPDFGPHHEATLITGNQFGADLRIAGRYSEALEFDERSVSLHSEVFGRGDLNTLRALSNLAVDYRMVGDFGRALELDAEVAAHWEDVGVNDPRALAAYGNMVRSYYGLGAYRAGIDVFERWLPALQSTFAPGNVQLLLAFRTYAIILRKAGRIDDAEVIIRENVERVEQRLGAGHDFSVAAAMSYANLLRQRGALDEAAALLDSVVKRYQSTYGEDHPLTLAAQVNQAILLRAGGDVPAARRMNQRTFTSLSALLGADHPYTLCAATSLASDLAAAGEAEQAARLSAEVLQVSQLRMGGGHPARDGGEHPQLLMRQINLSHDLRATGSTAEADTIFRAAMTGLSVTLDATHPEVLAAAQGARTESDIEPPPA